MGRKSTIKLLVINESDNEAERLVSLFRNAGRVARSNRPNSAEELHSALDTNNDEPCDLIVVDKHHPEITIDNVLEQVKKQNNPAPVIVLVDEGDDAPAYFDGGASDVVLSSDDNRLSFAAFREVEHLENRRELAALNEKLKESEERSELLMAQSQDAIAYISDGMIISTNALFAGRFGYEDPDDIDCIPIIDLIADSDQEKFKGLLKAQIQSGEGSTDFEFNGVNEASEEFNAAMQLSNAVLDGEDCIQVTVRDEIATRSSGGGQSDYDEATGLYSHFYFLSQLDSQIKQAQAGTTISSMLFIGIDGFYQLRTKHGPTITEQILVDLAKFIQENSANAAYISHFYDDAFTLLLPDMGTEKALEFSQTLCQQVSEHIIEQAGQSIKCTVSIGVVLIDQQAPEEPQQIVENGFIAAEAVRDDSDDEASGNGASVFVAARKQKSLGDAESDDDLDTFLEEAIEDERFKLMFNPVVSLKGTSGDYYEVETVMVDEDDAIKPAAEFLGTLQFNAVNTRLDRWIILEATKQLSIQRDQGNDTRIMINLTSNTLLDDTLLPWLSVALKAGGLPPESIIFQFMEDDIIKQLKAAKSFSEEVSKMGCHMAIASFGKDNESSNLLSQVKTTFVKIHGDFTEQIQSSGDTEEVKALVSKASETETKAIITNVENASAMAVIWQLGVDYIQGGYLSEPTYEMNYEFTDIA